MFPVMPLIQKAFKYMHYPLDVIAQCVSNAEYDRCWGSNHFGDRRQC